LQDKKEKSSKDHEGENRGAQEGRYSQGANPHSGPAAQNDYKEKDEGKSMKLLPNGNRKNMGRPENVLPAVGLKKGKGTSQS